jgi:hypothetical protein
VSALRYELGFYIPDDDILHSHRREHPQILYSHTIFGRCYRVQEENIKALNVSNINIKPKQQNGTSYNFGLLDADTGCVAMWQTHGSVCFPFYWVLTVNAHKRITPCIQSKRR